MSNIRIGYINVFCKYSHDKITEAYEAMCDEDEQETIQVLTDLKKFINDTIKDYQSELLSKKNADYDSSNGCVDNCSACRTGCSD